MCDNKEAMKPYCHVTQKHSRHPVGVDEGFNPYPYHDSPTTHVTSQTIVTQRALKLGIDEVSIPTSCLGVYKSLI